MIIRIWYGKALAANADNYEQLLRTTVFPSIEAKNIKGFKGIQLIRREELDHVEFGTIMWFDSLEAVKAYAGDQYEIANVSDKAKEFLSDYDKIVKHYVLTAATPVNIGRMIMI